VPVFDSSSTYVAELNWTLVTGVGDTVGVGVGVGVGATEPLGLGVAVWHPAPEMVSL
jgi:hypothetical protein